MANIVQSAVGTQRQFTKQPVATYQKSLRNLNATQGIVNTGVGERLYRSLTGLGDAAMKYAIGEEDRTRARVVEVEPLINAATEEDWKKLSAIELLNKYGKFQLADNPYAVAAIEQARGKYMSEKFTQQYNITMAESPVKEPEEERKRYDQEKRKFLEDNVNESYDVDQFYKGFWASNPQDLLNVTNQKIAEKSKSLMTIGKASFQAEASTYVRENADKSPEEFIDGIQKLINSSVLMSLQLDERKAAMEGILGEIATEVGSPDLIRKCANIAITNTDNGDAKETVGKYVDLNPYIKMAEDTAKARPNQYMLKQQETLARFKTVAELDNWWKNLTPTEQHMFKPDYGKYRVSLIADEEAAKKQMIRQNQKRISQNTSDQIGDIALARRMAGHADGTYCSSDQAYAAASKVLKNMQPGDTKTFAQVLLWSSNTKMQKEYTGYFKQGILGMSPDEMSDTSNPRSVTNGLALWNYNPAVFAATFGKDLASDMQTIQALIDFKGSETAGFELFCQGRDNMARNAEVKEAAETFSKAAMSDGDAVELTNADDPSNTVNISISADSFAQVNSSALKYMRASVPDEDAAKYILQSSLKKNYVAYDDRPIPQVVFAKKTDATNGIDASDDTYGAATQFMNAYKESANAEYPGMASTWWWGVDNKIHFGDPSYGWDEAYTLDEFYDKVNQWHYDRGAAEENSEEDTESAETEDSGATMIGSRRASYGGPNWNGW